MEPSNTPRLPRESYLLLPLIALAFYIAFIPHQSYPYPVHVDDWIHLANAEAIIRAGSTTYPEPFFGVAVKGLSSNLELGFQLFWGVFHQISGISWLTIFRYFPGIVFIITILSTYALAQRQGFGWEAAFFACLIPTTIGILGPAFLVPVAMGMLFIPLSLLLAFYGKSIWSYVVLGIFTCFLVAIHAPSAICLVIILIPYLFINVKGNLRHSLGIFLAVLVPFLAPFPWIFDMLLPTAKGLLAAQGLPEYVDFPLIIKTYGYLPMALCLLGTFWLAMRGGRSNYSLVLGLLALLVMLVTFYTFHYGIAIMYERGLMFMMLLVGMVAGAGLMAIKNISLPAGLAAWLKRPVITRNIGKALCLILVAVVLAIAIPERQDTRYYHLIDQQDYETFVWVRGNIGEDYSKALLEPAKATPFSALTGKYIYTRMHTAPTARDEEASRFLAEGCRDTAFLRENGITIVYTRGECHNPDLVEVHEGVYVLGE